MRLLADECCDAAVVSALSSEGHDVTYVTEIAAGIRDRDVLALAFQEDRILLTDNKDFGDLVVRMGLPAHGPILTRLKTPSAGRKAARLLTALDRLGDNLARHYRIVERDRVRSRPMPTP